MIQSRQYQGIIILLVILIIYILVTTWDSRRHLAGIWSASDTFLTSAGIGAMVLHIHKSRNRGHLVMIADDNTSVLFNNDIKISWADTRVFPMRQPSFSLLASIDTGKSKIFSPQVKFIMTENFDLRIEGTDGVLYADMYKV